jgi:type I restriction enzyme S subunit
LPEQRRIAEVLDRAEALRAKRRAALAQLDTLTQSIFLDLFGDPITNPKGWPTVEFSIRSGIRVW